MCCAVGGRRFGERELRSHGQMPTRSVSSDRRRHVGYRSSSAVGRCVLAHDVGKNGQWPGERGAHELSSPHLLGSEGVRLARKYNWPRVSRSTTSIMPEQAGQLRLDGWGRSAHATVPRRARQRSSAVLRLLFAKSPKCRMRTSPPGRT